MVKLTGISEIGNYDRLDKDEYFSMIALLISQRSTCLRKHVGAVIIDGDKIISSGYNGSVMGEAHCLDVGCEIEDGHCIRCLHAEQNAIIQLTNKSIFNRDNLELYVTDYPCKICAKIIAQAGIKRIHFVRDYQNDDFVEKLFKSQDIIIDKTYAEK